MPRTPSFTPIQTVLDGLIKTCGLEPRMVEYRLRSEWPSIVGNNVAQHALPDHIRFNKLYLSVDSPGWIQELTFFKPELLRKTNAALKRLETDIQVKEIVLRLDRGLSAGPDPQQNRPVS